MPPKCKYTKDEILQAALTLTRKEGSHALTARELAKRLKISVKPIFTAFTDMDELRASVRTAAFEVYADYQRDFADYTPAPKRYGMQLIFFAYKEPRLFSLLFVEKEPTAPDSAAQGLIGHTDGVASVLQRNYALSKEDALRLLSLIYAVTFGLAVSVAEGRTPYDEEEIARLLSTAFYGSLTALREKDLDKYLATAAVRKASKEETI